MDLDFLISPFFYNWLILGGVLLIVEVATFTLLFLWVAIAAIIMAGISFIFPEMALETQLWLFSGLVLLSVVVWSKVFKGKQNSTSECKINRRAERYIGRTATLFEPITNGYGKIRIEDSLWRVNCDQDLPAGRPVKIIAADGVILTVIPL